MACSTAVAFDNIVRAVRVPALLCVEPDQLAKAVKSWPGYARNWDGLSASWQFGDHASTICLRLHKDAKRPRREAESPTATRRKLQEGD